MLVLDEDPHVYGGSFYLVEDYYGVLVMAPKFEIFQILSYLIWKVFYQLYPCVLYMNNLQ